MFFAQDPADPVASASAAASAVASGAASAASAIASAAAPLPSVTATATAPIASSPPATAIANATAAAVAPVSAAAPDLPWFYALGFAVGTTLVLLMLLRVAQGILSPQKTAVKDFADKNAARHLMQVGQVLGVFMVAAAVVKNCVDGKDPTADVIKAGGFGVLGIMLVAAAGRLGTQLLCKSSLPKEIDRGNIASGVAGGSHYVAAGIIAAHAVAGNKLRDVGLSLLFFTIAVATLWAFVSLFRALTTYDDAEQIQGENLAASLSYAGLTIAVAIIVGTALDGDFVDWSISLKGYGTILLLALALYPVRQLFVQTVLLGAPFALRGGRLDVAVGTDRNEGLAVLEAATYIATALSVARLVTG